MSMQNHSVLSVGNVSVDIKSFSDEDPVPGAYRDGSIELVPGGVGRGMAINLKHLGFESAICSVIGKDVFGDFLRTGLEMEHVSTKLLKTSFEKKTALFSHGFWHPSRRRRLPPSAFFPAVLVGGEHRARFAFCRRFQDGRRRCSVGDNHIAGAFCGACLCGAPS